MFNDAALVVAGNAIDGVITHLQLHSGDPGAAGTANVTTAARVAASATVDGDGDLTWTNVAFTGVAASGATTWISYWSASSAGTNYGKAQITSGDLTANAAGEYTLVSLTETSSST